MLRFSFVLLRLVRLVLFFVPPRTLGGTTTALNDRCGVLLKQLCERICVVVPAHNLHATRRSPHLPVCALDVLAGLHDPEVFAEGSAETSVMRHQHHAALKHAQRFRHGIPVEVDRGGDGAAVGGGVAVGGSDCGSGVNDKSNGGGTGVTYNDSISR